jgi:rare lipoprotein A (peptidoglycan hydrolase)
MKPIIMLAALVAITQLSVATADSTHCPATAIAGQATWYSRESCRREGTGGKEILMANGQPLKDTELTCALWRVRKNGRPLRPTGALVRIKNVQNGKTLMVAWTDNGPGRVPRSKGVVVDLTPAAFVALGGNLKDGKIKVEVEIL